MLAVMMMMVAAFGINDSNSFSRSSKQCREKTIFSLSGMSMSAALTTAYTIDILYSKNKGFVCVVLCQPKITLLFYTLLSIILHHPRRYFNFMFCLYLFNCAMLPSHL